MKYFMDKIIKMKCYNRNISIDSDTDMSGDESSDTFLDATHQAEKEDRLIKGIFKCAHALEMSPEVVEMVILPCGLSENIASHIQHKLIHAFCLENDIQILEVDHRYFASIVRTLKTRTDHSHDDGCLLVTSEPMKTEFETDDKDDDLSEKFG